MSNSQRVGFLEQFPRLTLQSLTYTSDSWTAPSSGVWLGGELGLIQREPLPASGIIDQYNESLLNSSDLMDQFDVPTVLSRYNERNGEQGQSLDKEGDELYVCGHPPIICTKSKIF